MRRRGTDNPDSTVSNPTDNQIRAFWSWFERVADALGDNFEDAALLDELDSRVSGLGDIAWELGPGATAENALALSPDGAAELLPLTTRIVSMAPDVPRWEFLPARPARPANLEFSISKAGGDDVEVDAHPWRYVLLRFPDGVCDLVLEQGNLGHVGAADRYTAAVVFLDGLLGEARRLTQIHQVEPVVALTPEQAMKASPVTDLSTHLDSLGGGLWAKILWYRDFHDVPHVFCVSIHRGLLLFDSRFDEALDDYEPCYQVRLLEGVTPDEALDPDLVMRKSQAAEAIGQVPVTRDLFDDTRRERVRLPRHIGTTDLMGARCD